MSLSDHVEVMAGDRHSIKAAASLDPAIPRWIEFEGQSFLHITAQNAQALGEFLRFQNPQKFFLSNLGYLRCKDIPEFDQVLPHDAEQHLVVFVDSHDQLGGFARFSMKPKDYDVRYASSIIDGSEYLRRGHHRKVEGAPGYDDYTGTGPICCLKRIQVFSQRRGLGARAIRYATQVFGCERLEVASTDEAVGFYSKCGFISTGMRLDMGEGGSLPVMVLKNPAIVCNEPREFSKLALSVLSGGLITSPQFRSSLSHHRRVWTRELGLRPESSITEIAAVIAGRITLALQEPVRQGNPNSSSFLFAEAIGKASRLGGSPLIDSKEFRASKFEFFQEAATNPNYWEYRIVGSLRARLAGLTDRGTIVTALRNLVKGDIDPHILGRDGYRRVAEIFCGGRMSKAHALMRAACKAEVKDFAALGWGGVRSGGTKDPGAARVR